MRHAADLARSEDAHARYICGVAPAALETRVDLVEADAGCEHGVDVHGGPLAARGVHEAIERVVREAGQREEENRDGSHPYQR